MWIPKVLFVDDEPYILDTYLRMLRGSVFECIVLSESTRVFELPYLREMKLRFPNIKRLLISGDTFNLQDSYCDFILQKPLTKLDLINCLSSLK